MIDVFNRAVRVGDYDGVGIVVNCPGKYALLFLATFEFGNVKQGFHSGCIMTIFVLDRGGIDEQITPMTVDVIKPPLLLKSSRDMLRKAEGAVDLFYLNL